jgi:hypothetical protein
LGDGDKEEVQVEEHLELLVENLRVRRGDVWNA